MADASRRSRRGQLPAAQATAGGDGPAGGRRTRRARRSPAERFYQDALSEAEQALLPTARELEGLGEEIALLRVKIQTAVAEHPENFPLLLKGVALLVRAVAAQYRLSQRAEDDLYQSILGVLEGIGGVLHPEGFSGLRAED